MRYKKPRPIQTPWSQRISEFARGPMVFIVWVASAVGAYLLLTRPAERFEFIGVAQDLLLFLAQSLQPLAQLLALLLGLGRRQLGLQLLQLAVDVFLAPGQLAQTVECLARLLLLLRTTISKAA